ncbi:hypothetical protein G7Y79_00014g036660 [Physcia stellaris]|nr:hypothetical protein G7Y79_00014g036660 [Physcia stellaris]
MMAEAFGIVAGIVSLCKAEQVKSLSDITQSVEVTPSALVHDEILFRAKSVISELHQVFTVTLVSRESGSARLRRCAWFRNKRKIARLQRNLKDASNSLLAALSTNILSDYRSSTTRMEATLADVHQLSTEISLIIKESDGQAGISESPLVIQGHYHRDASIATKVFDTASATSYSNGMMNGLGRPLIGRSGFLSDATGLPPSRYAIARSSSAVQHGQDPQAPPPSPCGLFESSASFLPDTCVINCDLPQLFCYYITELDATEFIGVNHCTLFYHIAPSRWIRLTLSITTTFDSDYWILQVPSMAFNSKVRFNLPCGMTLKMTRFFEKQPNLGQDAHLSLFLGNQLRDEKNE